MPTPPPHPHRRVLIIIGITIGVLTAAAAMSARNQDYTTQGPSSGLTSTSRPAGRVPLPPINRAMPRPLPPLTDPVGLATQVATTLWGTLTPDVVGYQIMAATSPDLSDPELEHLTGIIDSEQASGPASLERVDLVPPSGIDEGITVIVTALDPARSLRMRITCTPDCRLLGITR
jgi:hypothetical protein